MSSRFYPIYQKGNPQLRVFLPNFWMKLVRPKEKQPPNIVQFMVPTAMTNYDIRQYLEKIYKINVVDVYSEIENGKIKEAYKGGYVVKEDDFRRVFVTLHRDEKFTFPDITISPTKIKEKADEEKIKEESKREAEKFRLGNKNRPNLPHWYSF